MGLCGRRLKHLPEVLAIVFSFPCSSWKRIPGKGNHGCIWDQKAMCEAGQGLFTPLSNSSCTDHRTAPPASALDFSDNSVAVVVPSCHHASGADIV